MIETLVHTHVQVELPASCEEPKEEEENYDKHSEDEELHEYILSQYQDVSGG